MEDSRQGGNEVARGGGFGVSTALRSSRRADIEALRLLTWRSLPFRVNVIILGSVLDNSSTSVGLLYFEEPGPERACAHVQQTAERLNRLFS